MQGTEFKKLTKEQQQKIKDEVNKDSVTLSSYPTQYSHDSDDEEQEHIKYRPSESSINTASLIQEE